MKWIANIVVLMLVGGVVACSDGGGRSTGGIRCPQYYNPVDMNVLDTNKQKISLKSGNSLEIAPGTYKYMGADIAYIDSANDAKIHTTDKRYASGKDEKFVATLYCVRNYNKLQAGDGLAFTVKGVSDLTVHSDKSLVIGVRDYSVDISAAEDRQEKFEKSNDPVASLADAYKGAEDFFMYEVVKDKTYQIRARYPGTKESGDIYLLIHLERETDPAALPPWWEGP